MPTLILRRWHLTWRLSSFRPFGRTPRAGFYGGGQSYFTHIAPYSVWEDTSTPLWWTPSNFGGKGKGGNVSWPLSKTLLKKDQCGALVDLANDTLDVSGAMLLRHADASCNGTHSTELQSREVVRDIERHDVSRPLFAYVAWHAVHDPLQVPDVFKNRFRSTIEDESRRTLAGMINNLDGGVLNITSALKARGMWRNTLTIVTTDK